MAAISDASCRQARRPSTRRSISWGLRKRRVQIMRRSKTYQFVSLAMVLLLSLATLTAARDDKKKQKVRPEGKAVLWTEPVDISSRDLYLGPGGEEMKPDLSR